MTGLTLHLDAARWRDHLAGMAASTPGLVPVVKGNGYGYGLGRLAAESAALGVDTVAVGVPGEVAAVAEAFPGDVVVLSAFNRRLDLARELLGDDRVVTTVSRLTDLAELADLAESGVRPRVQVEVLTSMRRHGIPVTDLPATAALLDRVRFEGWTLHLPLRVEGRYAEAERLVAAALAVAPGTFWLSHLSPEEIERLGVEVGWPDHDPLPVRARVGTRLWLGAESTRQTTAEVLDVFEVERGDRAGYRGRAVPSAGRVVVVAGGTSHGVGLEAPTAAVSLRQRAVALATGSLGAAGWALSPYTIGGRKRWFLEPPHMQSSQLFLPASVPAPSVGDQVPVELRLTTATVDRIVDAG